MTIFSGLDEGAAIDILENGPRDGWTNDPVVGITSFVDP